MEGRVNSGPIKSIPTLENGGFSDTRKSGNGGAADGSTNLPSSLLHIEHRRKYFLISSRNLGVQYLDRR